MAKPVTTCMLFVSNPIEDPTDLTFYEFEGDLSRFNEVWINYGNAPELERELSELIYHPETGMLNLHDKMLKEPTRDWDHFVTCGFGK